MNLRQRLLTVLLTAFAAGVTTVQGDTGVRMTINANNRGPAISDYQYGLFFEEINHAGDGGLYAELIRNRSFEDGDTAPWYVWGGAEMELTSDNPLNEAQTRSLLVTTEGATPEKEQGIVNMGYWGINVVAGRTYELSFFMRQVSGNYKDALVVMLCTKNGQVISDEVKVEGTPVTGEWVKMTATITPTQSAPDGIFSLGSKASGKMQLDVVSLFPPTWKNRKNGLRPDLAEKLAATHPTFLRFPGGCYVEGEGTYADAFQWKKTIGPIETRPGHWNNNWGYRSSDGLGFDEYLQLCEDLGAAPMFVVNVGLGHGYTIALDEMQPLVQDCLDAIEYANGDASTEWGAKRVANGHPAPYNLKFIEIGNENYQANSSEQSQNYAERYYMFYKAIKEKYPDIVTIGNVEAWGTDNPTWRNDYPVELVDEHYYRSHQWMRENYRKYDGYSRQIGIYNGEYAANDAGTYGQYGNMNSALGEAIYMLGMERNSDVCRMASFAPIFTHESNPLWKYDMIHFNSSSVFCTPSYYVQLLLPQYLGKQNLKWTEVGNTLDGSLNTKVGVGTWLTTAAYTDMSVTNANGTVLASNDFGNSLDDWTLSSGSWSLDEGELVQHTTAENCTAVFNTQLTGDHYIYKVKANKWSGKEGFLIIFNYQDEKNYAWWNIGGWSNTKHAVEVCTDGVKTTVAEQKGSIVAGEWYDLEVEVDGRQVTCRMNGQEVHSFVLPQEQRLYQSVQLDEEAGKLYVKVVNPTDKDVALQLDLKNMTATGGRMVRLGVGDALAENDMATPERVVPQDMGTIDGNLSNLTMAAYSLSIMVIDVTMGQTVESVPAYEDEDADMYGYLYAHMHSNKEISCYALSSDGQSFDDLLGSEAVIDNTKYTITGGMRDAFVYRTQSGKFMLAATDMTSALGWESNHIMTFLLSNDLVHWDKYLSVDLKSQENLDAIGATADQITAAWAPEIIYDPVTGKYMAYYAIGIRDDRHRIYYSLMNEDLSGFTTPRLLFDPGTDVIDADIVYNQVDKQYVMIYKGEQAGDKCLYQATAPYLVPTTETTGSCQWNIVEGFKVYESGAIEGCSTYRPIGSNTWRLAYMQYGGGYDFKVRELDEHCLNPSASTIIRGNLAAQHGSFLKLTFREYEHLLNWDKVVTCVRKGTNMYQTAEMQRALELGRRALEQSGTFDEEYAAMKTAAEALTEAMANSNDELIRQAKEGLIDDLTPLIQNASFTQRDAGWKGTPFDSNAFNYDAAEHYNKTFDVYQQLQGLPNGEYVVRCQAFYREGGDGPSVAANLRANGQETIHAMLYANDVSVPLQSIFDSPDLAYGVNSAFGVVPDDMRQAAAFFEAGGYWNEVRVTVTDGTLRLGIRKDVYVAKDWTIFDNFTLTYLGDPGAPDVKIKEGYFYLKHVQTGNYLGAGNDYGTRASLLAEGLDLTVTPGDGDAYYLNTYVRNGGKDQYLARTTDGYYYCDQPSMLWTFVSRGDKAYALTCNGKDYLCQMPANPSVVDTTTDPMAEGAAWVLVPYQTRVRELLASMEQATESNPVDATMLVFGHAFNRNDLRVKLSWIDAPKQGGWQPNYCAEKYNTMYDMYQDLVGLPNATYKVTVQGFYREGDYGPAAELRKQGEEHLYAQLYANDVSVPIKSIFEHANFIPNYGVETEFGFIPNNMIEGGNYLWYNDAQNYMNELWVRVTDGTLRLGIRKDVYVEKDWTLFDNFTLTCYGNATPPTAVASVTADTKTAAVYTLNGTCVDTTQLKPGIYVTEGKKVIVK